MININIYIYIICFIGNETFFYSAFFYSNLKDSHIYRYKI